MYHRNQKIQIANTPQVGQVVIIRGEKIPRRVWKLSKIEWLISGNDGMSVQLTFIYLGTDTCNILSICYTHWNYMMDKLINQWVIMLYRITRIIGEPYVWRFTLNMLLMGF